MYDRLRRGNRNSGKPADDPFSASSAASLRPAVLTGQASDKAYDRGMRDDSFGPDTPACAAGKHSKLAVVIKSFPVEEG